jgi:hypothetical protein
VPCSICPSVNPPSTLLFSSRVHGGRRGGTFAPATTAAPPATPAAARRVRAPAALRVGVGVGVAFPLPPLPRLPGLPGLTRLARFTWRAALALLLPIRVPLAHRGRRGGVGRAGAGARGIAGADVARAGTGRRPIAGPVSPGRAAAPTGPTPPLTTWLEVALALAHLLIGGGDKGVIWPLVTNGLRGMRWEDRTGVMLWNKLCGLDPLCNGAPSQRTATL